MNVDFQFFISDEPPRTQSIVTMLWAVTVRMWSGYSPITYSYQASLPRMPVPRLKTTLENTIESLKPLYGENSEKILHLQKESKVRNLCPQRHVGYFYRF